LGMVSRTAGRLWGGCVSLNSTGILPIKCYRATDTVHKIRDMKQITNYKMALALL
jgi:hypothetical protein